MLMIDTTDVKKTQRKKIISLYSGNKKRESLGARSIASEIGVSRRKVMTVLQEEGLANFSEGSYR